MRMQQFTTDLDSRVRSFPGLSKAPLTPVVEAVVNAVDAIRERQRTDAGFGNGKIEISVHRDPQTVLPGLGLESPVSGFSISDDGVGFTDARMASFLRFPTGVKPAPGRPGAGRLSWLKGFENAAVSSVYSSAQGMRKRSFVLRTGVSGVNTDSSSAGDGASPGTTVTLKGLHDKRRPPLTADAAARELSQSLASYLIDPRGLDILLLDGDKTLNLRDFLDYETVDIEIKGEHLTLYHMKRSQPGVPNELSLCAHSRVVRTVNLSHEIPGLDKSLYDRAGYSYAGILTGPFLDRSVRSGHTSFAFPDSSEHSGLLEGTISLRDITNACVLHVAQYLNPDLDAVRKAQNERLNDVIRAHPRLQLAWTQKPGVLRTIQPKDSSSVIEKKLRDAQFGYLETVRNRTAKNIEALDAASPAKYRRLFAKCASDIAEAERCPAAESAGYRADTLRLLERAVTNDFSASDLGSALVSLLYRPVAEGGTTVPSDAHNLWAVDERLTYSAFLASLSSAAAEPELFTGVPTAWGEKNRQVHGTLSVVQIQPAGSDTYTFSSNPVEDMLSYARLLLEGNSMDTQGRPLVLKSNAQLFLYAITEIPKSMQQALSLKGLTHTPDGNGYFGYDAELHAYIEVISPEKLLQDARRRNAALFERLGLGKASS